MKTAPKILLVFAAVAGIVALFYAWVDFHGARVWEGTRRHLRARGEPLDPAASLPAPVADDAQNLALAPVFARVYNYQIDPATGKRTLGKLDDAEFRRTITALPFGLETGKSASYSHFDQLDWASGHPLDLDALARFYRQRRDFPHSPLPQSPAADVLLALTRFGPVLEEVSLAATTRPKLGFPVNWFLRGDQDERFSYYTPIMAWIETFSLHACASLAQGDPDAALRDLRVCLRLRDTVAGEPVMLAWNYDYYNLNYLLQPVWEGLAARRWSAAQLTELQGLLARVDSIAERRQRIRGKRSFSLPTFADEASKPAGFRHMLASAGGVYRNPSLLNAVSKTLPLLPRGWFDEAVARYADAEQTYLLDAIDVGAHRVDAHRIDAGWRLTYRAPPVPANFLVKNYLGTHYWGVHYAACIQAAVDHAVVACALERYYLDHQAYPADLAALPPAYLDRVSADLMDGAPMRYQMTYEGRYRLWSVGWDGVDDDGQFAWSSAHQHRQSTTQDDWPWQYEAIPER